MSRDTTKSAPSQACICQTTRSVLYEQVNQVGEGSRAPCLEIPRLDLENTSWKRPKTRFLAAARKDHQKMISANARYDPADEDEFPSNKFFVGLSAGGRFWLGVHRRCCAGGGQAVGPPCDAPVGAGSLRFVRWQVLPQLPRSYLACTCILK
eukprot:COSAG02_NODE_1098_length_14587_cov_9.462590_15_plen_152_part_00